MLTNKQKKFIDEYLKDLNATQAAIRAGYSEKTAYSIGIENLRKPEIQEKIKQRQQELSEQAEVTQSLLIQELLKVVKFDIGEYVNYKTVKAIDGYDGDGQPIIGYQQVIDLKDSETVDTSLIQEVKSSRGTVSIKAYDKIKAIEMLGKHLGLFEGPEIQKLIDQLQKDIEELRQSIGDDKK